MFLRLVDALTLASLLVRAKQARKYLHCTFFTLACVGLTHYDRSCRILSVAAMFAYANRCNNKEAVSAASQPIICSRKDVAHRSKFAFEICMMYLV